MTLTDRRFTRPPLPENAGKNTILLDLAVTRDELSTTVRQLAVSLKPRHLIRENPGAVLAAAQLLITALGSFAVRRIERRNADV